MPPVVKSGEHAAHVTLGPAEFMSEAEDLLGADLRVETPHDDTVSGR